MALKDWEKVDNSGKWRNKKNRLLLHVINYFGRKMTKHKCSKYTWQVNLTDDFSFIQDKVLDYWNTKSQALKFARAYMRKH